MNNKHFVAALLILVLFAVVVALFMLPSGHAQEYALVASSEEAGAIEVKIIELVWDPSYKSAYYALVQELQDDGHVGVLKLSIKEYAEFKSLKVATTWVKKKQH